MQTWVKITKWEKGKRTLIDCERLSIQEQSSQPLIQSRLTLKHGEKALQKSPYAVFLKTKTKICNRPSQNWLSRVKNWGRTGIRASQISCTVDVHGCAPYCAQLLASRQGREHPSRDHALEAATSSVSFGAQGLIKPSFLSEFQQ